MACMARLDPCRALELAHEVNFRCSLSVVTSCTVAADRRQVGKRSAWNGRIGCLAIGTEVACMSSESCPVCCTKHSAALDREAGGAAESSAKQRVDLLNHILSSVARHHPVMVEELGGR